jgi:hypothetical protein
MTASVSGLRWRWRRRPKVTPIVSIWRRKTQEDEDSLIIAVVLEFGLFRKS